MSDAPTGNLFDNIEPHRHLPDETRLALWAACDCVRKCPSEFAAAAAWLDRDYSEAAVCERHLKESERQCRRNLWQVIHDVDRCDTFPRRLAFRASNLKLAESRRLKLLVKFRSVRELERVAPEFIVDLSKHPEKVREWIVQLTIASGRFRGMRLREGEVIISNDRREGDAVIDAENVETAWRSMDEKTRQHIRRMRKRRKERDERIRRQSKDRMGRFLEAVRDAVETDIPAMNCVDCARRVVLLAAMIASPEPISLSAEFKDMPWESEGNMLVISGPYVPGRQTVFEKYDSVSPTQWSIAGFLAGSFGDLVARAVAVLEQGKLAPVGDFKGPSSFFPPFFVIEPEATFADAWETFCCDVLNRHEKTTEIYKRKAPERGVDLYWREKGYAYQCKSVSDDKGKFNVTKAVESIKAALEIRKTLPWDKFYLCVNVEITGNQVDKLRKALPDIELLTPSYWGPRCQEQWEHVKGRFKRLVPV
jgi:hypothetical protein